MSEKHYCLYCMSPCAPDSACPKCGLTGEAYRPEPHHLPPNTVLNDRYLIGRVLGEGGFGITYIGFDMKLELKVAIKEYFPIEMVGRNAGESLSVHEYASYAVNFDEGKKKFLREARAMARMIKQPEIVNVREYFESNHTAYIIMEFINGITYKELIEQQKGHISTDEVLRTFEPLFEALTNLHAEGLIHRDISPDNLMLENGKIKLLDFGCARDTASSDATRTIMTKHGYAPLEQYGNGRQGPWTDVYALSATIYFCITGRKPPQALDRTIEDSLVPPRKLGAKLTETQEAGLLAGMAVRPSKRTRSIKELHTALYGGQLGQILLPSKARAFFGSKQRNLLMLLGCLVLCLALGLTYAVTRPKSVAPANAVDPASPVLTEAADAAALPVETAGIAHTAYPTDTEGLVKALADDSVSDVVYRSENRIGGTVTVTKPLRIRAGCAADSVIVAGDGCLIIESGARLASEGILRTVNGGRIVIEEGASLEKWGGSLLMLEREANLEGAERLSGLYGKPTIVHQYPAPEQQPVYVSTLDELLKSQSYADPYVIITADIDAGEEGIWLKSKWVEISQGVRLTCGTVWLENGANLFLYGALNCPYVTSDSLTGAFVNDGTVEGDITLEEATVNLGRMDGKVVSRWALHNLAENWTPECLYTPTDGSSLYNAGGITLTGTENLLDDRILFNCGTLSIEGTLRMLQGSRLYNQPNSAVTVSGELELDDSHIVNDGLLSIPEGGKLTRLKGGYVRSQYGSLEAFDEDALLSRPGVMLSGTVFEDNRDAFTIVESADELERALADESVHMIGLYSATIEYPGDLTLTKPMRINAEGHLRVAGDLTVRRDFAVENFSTLEVAGALIVDSDVTVNLGANVQAKEMRLTRAFVRIEFEMTMTLDRLVLEDSSCFASLSHSPVLSAKQITLSGDSHLSLYGESDTETLFADAEIWLEAGSSMSLNGIFGAFPKRITIAKDALLTLARAAEKTGGVLICEVEGRMELEKPGFYHGSIHVAEGATLYLAREGTYEFSEQCVVDGVVLCAPKAEAVFPEGASMRGTIETEAP